MKLAVLFPGIGYHCDKPLLYFSRDIAHNYQYDIRTVPYTGLKKGSHGNLAEAFQLALEQTEEILSDIRWDQYEDILFVSKSLGTAVAAAYAEKYHIKCKNVYYTPLERTFRYHPQPGIAFHGTKDSWADTDVVTLGCREHDIKLHVIENVNHSLETEQDVQQNIVFLKKVMELTEEYISGKECGTGNETYVFGCQGSY